MSKNIFNQFNKIKSSKIIFISYAGRSGSFFLGGLLDDSPNILNFNPYLDRKIFYILWDYYKNLNKKKFHYLHKSLKIKIKEHFLIIKNKSQVQKKTPDKMHIKIEKMFNIFKKIIIDNKKNLNLDLLLKNFYFSFSKIFLKKKKITKNTKILINIHGVFPPNDFIYILKGLKKFSWITMLRHPLKSIDSHCKHTVEQEKNTIKFQLSAILVQYKMALIFLYRNKHGYLKRPFFEKFIQNLKKLNVSKNFYFVSFERLHLYPEKSMKNICAALGINFSSKNLCDTISGHPVYFEGQQGKISGFSKNQAQNQELNFMSYFEKKTVEIIFKDEIKSLKYNSSYKKRFYNLIYLISLFKLKANIQKGNLAKLIIKFIFFDIFKEFKKLLGELLLLLFKNNIITKNIKFIN